MWIDKKERICDRCRREPLSCVLVVRRGSVKERYCVDCVEVTVKSLPAIDLAEIGL